MQQHYQWERRCLHKTCDAKLQIAPPVLGLLKTPNSAVVSQLGSELGLARAELGSSRAQLGSARAELGAAGAEFGCMLGRVASWARRKPRWARAERVGMMAPPMSAEAAAWDGHWSVPSSSREAKWRLHRLTLR